MDNNPVALNDVMGLSTGGDDEKGKPVPGGDDPNGPPSLPESRKLPLPKKDEQKSKGGGKFWNLFKKAEEELISVVIFIADPDTRVDEDRMNEDKGKYKYIVASDFQDAAKKLTDAKRRLGNKKVAINNLVIRAHGSEDGNIALISKDLSGYNRVKLYKTDDPQTKALGEIRGLLTENATVVFATCWIGASEERSQITADFMAAGTNRTVYINTVPTNANKMNDENENHVADDNEMVWFNFDKWLVNLTASYFNHGGFKIYKANGEQSKRIDSEYYDVKTNSATGGVDIKKLSNFAH